MKDPIKEVMMEKLEELKKEAKLVINFNKRGIRNLTLRRRKIV